MLSESVSFWTKGDILDLLFEWGQLENDHDSDLFSYALDRDELLEFACFCFCRGWGDSRNFSVLTEEEQQDDRIKRLFEYVDKLRG